MDANPGALPPRQRPMPLSLATPCSHARLPATLVELSPCSYSPPTNPIRGWAKAKHSEGMGGGLGKG